MKYEDEDGNEVVLSVKKHDEVFDECMDSYGEFFHGVDHPTRNHQG